jgi:two-component system phosphate regulon sensor histidine kinase PhoR
MPPLDSWLHIAVRTPVLLLLALLLVGLVAAGVLVCQRLLTRTRRLSNEARDLRARLADCTEHQAQSTSAGEAYRHFIYNISHEVSNPLQSIQTNLENMASCSLDEAGRWGQYHAIITTEVGRLARLTENLRLLSHLETRGAPTVREPVNLKGVIEDVIMALFEIAEARAVRLRYVGPERPARVLGDRDGLRQVLTNLVDNGVKYSRPEGGEVIISVQEEHDRLSVRVSDEGRGIAAEDLPHLFDTAYRAPDARSFGIKGSGLGLAIVKRIVEQHGGEIQVESRPGEGAAFSFALPSYAPSQQP